MSEHNYFASLKNKEFLVLQKLCYNSPSLTDKKKFEKELEEIHLEIKNWNDKCIFDTSNHMPLVSSLLTNYESD